LILGWIPSHFPGEAAATGNCLADMNLRVDRLVHLDLHGAVHRDVLAHVEETHNCIIHFNLDRSIDWVLEGDMNRSVETAINYNLTFTSSHTIETYMQLKIYGLRHLNFYLRIFPHVETDVDRGIHWFHLANRDIAAIWIIVPNVYGIAVGATLADRHLFSLRLIYAHVNVVVVLRQSDNT